MGRTPLPQSSSPGDGLPRPIPIKHSKNARWRAVVLILVHILFAIHLAHWKLTGSTLTPVEPSEAMFTLEQGLVNAGFILFALLILSTLVFGRFFCGWGCHVVALQDLCSWLLKKVGIRPKPIRSRILVWVPVMVAFYIFFWPQVVRIMERRAFPELQLHLTTEKFWETFPNVQIALLTFFVCGFLIVYLLGNKAFCTYGCPYGAFFYHADKLAPGKIRVTDACNNCGHCTTACTSNVRVHEEVRDYGMVVDAGCMKCLDCVSVCPKEALYFGFGKPTALVSKSKLLEERRPKAQKLPNSAQARPFDFHWLEEVGLVLFFFVGMFAFRGLYGAIPILLAVGMASIFAFVVIFGLRLLYSKHVRLQRFQLKQGGRIRPAGLGFALALLLVLAFTSNSAVVMTHIHLGNAKLNVAQALYNRADPASQGKIEDLSRSARQHYLAAESIGRYPVADTQSKLGSIARYLGETEKAKAHFQRAIELNPNWYAARGELAGLFAAEGNIDAAFEHWDYLVKEKEDIGPSWGPYAEQLMKKGRDEEALRAYEFAAKLSPDSFPIRLNQALLYGQLDQLDESEKQLGQLVKDFPKEISGWMNLALLQSLGGRYAAAAETYDSATRLAPQEPGAWLGLADAHDKLEDETAAFAAIRRAIELDPDNGDVLDQYFGMAYRWSRIAEEARWIESRLKNSPRLVKALTRMRAGIVPSGN